MKPAGIRAALLRSGMGCFLFAVCVSAFNILALPYARACYGYAALPMWIACALAVALFCACGRAIRRLDEARARQAASLAGQMCIRDRLHADAAGLKGLIERKKACIIMLKSAFAGNPTNTCTEKQKPLQEQEIFRHEYAQLPRPKLF